MPSKKLLMRMARDEARKAADVRTVAEQQAGYRPESRFPEACLELAGRILDHDRNRLYGEVTNRQREALAAGMPFAEITYPDGSSRADWDLAAPGRYARRRAANLAAEAATRQ